MGEYGEYVGGRRGGGGGDIMLTLVNKTTCRMF